MGKPADEKVAKLSLAREEGFNYWFKGGAVWRQRADEAAEKVAETGVSPDRNYLYFLDDDGDLARKARPGAAAVEAPAKPAGKPVTFRDAFKPLRAHVGKAVHVQLNGKKRPATIFDWSKLDGDARGMLIESQLLELAQALGKGWHSKQVPFAIVGGESHPVPMDELDQQCDGVLLLELSTGAVLWCPDPSSANARRVADSTAALELSR